MGRRPTSGRAPIFDRNVVYGGRGRARKKPRPISLRRPMHLVMMSSHARGASSFLRPGRPAKIEALLKRLARAFGIRVLERAIRPDHLHLLVRTTERRALQKFLRALAGLLARLALSAERGRPWERPISALEKAGFRVKRLTREGAGFWDARPYSRIHDVSRGLTALRRQILHKAIGAVGFTTPKSNSSVSDGIAVDTT